MNAPFIADQEFKGIDYRQKRLPKGEYENCHFLGCNFADGFLDNNNFMECRFVECNLSNANLKHTQFKEVSFSSCKMMGLRFEDCNDLLISFQFVQSSLNLSSFYKLPLKHTVFSDCKLLEVDFTEADLSLASFKGCNLKGAVFENSILEKADFRQAINFDIDPENNRLKKARFSQDGLPGLLHKHGIVVG